MPKQSANRFLTAVIFSGALLLGSNPVLRAADPEPANLATNSTPEANAVSASEAQNQDLIRQAIEQIRREATLASRQVMEQASHNVEIVAQRLDETLTARLGAIEHSLEEQHRRDLEVMQNSNRTLLLIAGIFGVVGVLGILIAAAIIVRAMNRLSEVALALPVGHGPTPTVLNAGEVYGAGQNQLDQASIRFLGAIERLEKRIQELELTAQPNDIEVEHAHFEREVALPQSKALPGPSASAALSATAVRKMQPSMKSISDPAEATEERSSQATILVGKGQALMHLGQAEEALICFDNAILIDPENADALVKKGMALEKLQKMEEALASYDRAIATNSSLTLAYLYKGAVCNRLQRFREALECYEKALKTEQKTITP